MKLTTNYIIYLNEDNKVQCAKCRLTGRFVKRVNAQTEYNLEYVYKLTFKGFISFMFTALFILFTYKSVKISDEQKLESLEVEMFKAYQEKDFLKFNVLNAKRYEMEYGL